MPGTKRYKLESKNLNEDQVWDVTTLGVRVFRFRDGPLATLRDVLETAMLFIPEAIKIPPAFVIEKNVEFLETYAKVPMVKRKIDVEVMLNESEIHSGDFIGIRRMNGLESMQTFATGQKTGHTVIAIWEDGQLYIAESTSNSAYWPTNGIQRTPYRKWLEQAREARYSVVHVPLAPKYRAMFDEEAANAFFHAVENLDYGYSTMLMSWIDTKEHNYPCLPPDYDRGGFSYCLSWRLIEVVYPLIRGSLPAADKMFLEAWNRHVAGSPFAGLDPVQLYRAAAAKGMEPEEIMGVVEEDWTRYSQRYNNGTRTRDLSMVCDVFVCFMWKAGGLFREIGDDFNCVEQQNLDVYGLTVVERPAARPQQCVAADPDNDLCQLMGEYELRLPLVGTRAPYRHMQDRCPSRPPAYERPDDC